MNLLSCSVLGLCVQAPSAKASKSGCKYKDMCNFLFDHQVQHRTAATANSRRYVRMHTYILRNIYTSAIRYVHRARDLAAHLAVGQLEPLEADLRSRRRLLGLRARCVVASLQRCSAVAFCVLARSEVRAAGRRMGCLKRLGPGAPAGAPGLPSECLSEEVPAQGGAPVQLRAGADVDGEPPLLRALRLAALCNSLHFERLSPNSPRVRR